LGKRSQEDEIAEALNDMPRWRAKTARSFLGYAVLIAIMGVLLAGQTWLFRHKIAAKFARNPVSIVVTVGGTIYAAFACASVVPMLLVSRHSLKNHDAQMAELKKRLANESGLKG
jgi:hypothetical protein